MTTKKNNKTTTTSNLSNTEFVAKMRRLTPGKSVTSATFGTVKCTRAAKDAKCGKKMFSVSKSTKAPNRGHYTFEEVCAAFGLKTK